MQKRITLTLIAMAILIQSYSIPSAHAGSRKHHLLQGVIIGAGAAIIGAAIAGEIHEQSTRGTRREYTYGPRGKNHNETYGRHDYRNREDKPYRNSSNRHYKKGYWTVQKVWVSPLYGKRWNPGHYNKKGRWVNGKHDRVIIREGYWEKRRIWTGRY